ncbi:MAG: MBL fold metallo-hydrolase [Marinifilaceae bacterium]
MSNRRGIKMAFIVIGVLLLVGVVIYNHPAWGRTPSKERLERMKMSRNFNDGQFNNESATPQLTSKKGRWETFYSFFFNKNGNREPITDIESVKTDLHSLNREENVVVWFGHGSYFIQMEGKRFLIDPVLTKEFPMSLMFKPFKGADGYGVDDIPEIDYLIITHDHWDHLDFGTVKALLNRVDRAICPLGVGEYLEYWGYKNDNIIEMDWRECRALNDSLNIHCLPSRHFSGRGLRRNRTLWASFLVECNNKRIYLSGDGGYDKHFKEIGNEFGPLDLVVLENGQYNEDWKYIHLMPELMQQTVSDLKARSVLTVHHSKYALARHDWDEPLKNISELAKSTDANIMMSKIGEKTMW